MKSLRRTQVSAALVSKVPAFLHRPYRTSGAGEQQQPAHPLLPKRRLAPARKARSSTSLQEPIPHSSPSHVSLPSQTQSETAIASDAKFQRVAMPSQKSTPGAYARTLEKPLIPRHGGSASSSLKPAASPAADPVSAAEERELAELTRKDGYDPATVVRVNTRTRQLHLNSIQKELVWSARRKEYQTMLERVVTCLQSHRSPIEKCFTLLALHDEAIQRRLRLRADTYEDIFHAFYAVAVQPKGTTGHMPAASAQASLTTGQALFEEDLSGCPAVSGSVPDELGSTAAASQALLTPHAIGNLWEMYRYMVDSGTDPSPRVVQYVMGILEHAVAQAADAAREGTPNGSTTLLEAKAHSLMMDLDRFQIPPTEYTLNSYIGVCDGCGAMHLAVARVADFQARHERQASAGTYAKLITGLVRHGQSGEAMSVVSTMQGVPMTVHLLNAVLQAARHSPDPLSAFTFYRAAIRTHGSTGLAPSQVTYSILLEVIREEMDAEAATRKQTDTQANLDFLLREMRKHRVKGNGLFLNKLLGAFCGLGRAKEAQALCRSMEAKGIRVFDELRSA